MYAFVSTRCAIALLLLFTIAVSGLPQTQAGSTSIGSSSVLAPSASPNATISMLPPTKAFQTSASSPTVNIGLGFFQLMDVSVGTKLNRGAHDCYLEFGGADILGCKGPYAVVGNTYCVDMNGRHSVAICDGIVTVDFPSQPSAPTYIHYTASNGTYTGCTAPTKSSGGSCINNQLGQGSFGNPNYVGDWCVMDITQYQKKDPSAPESSTAAQYRYAISIYDSETTSTTSDSKNGRNLIASTKSGETFYGPDKSPVTVNFDGTSSKLPGQLVLTSGNVDSDPYTLSYQSPYLTGDLSVPGAQVFDAYDTAHQCSLANVFPDGGHGNTWGYDSGNRKNTCGFSC